MLLIIKDNSLLKHECQPPLLNTSNVVLVQKGKSVSEARFVAKGDVFY